MKIWVTKHHPKILLWSHNYLLRNLEKTQFYIWKNQADLARDEPWRHEVNAALRTRKLNEYSSFSWTILSIYEQLFLYFISLSTLDDYIYCCLSLNLHFIVQICQIREKSLLHEFSQICYSLAYRFKDYIKMKIKTLFL